PSALALCARPRRSPTASRAAGEQHPGYHRAAAFSPGHAGSQPMIVPDPQASFEFQRTLVLVLDLCGTFAFAVSGATAAVRHRLDLFGVLVVSFAASTFGGISRDVLIGDTPPAAFEDWRYLAAAMAAGVIAFYWSPVIERLRNPVRMLDA